MDLQTKLKENFPLYLQIVQDLIRLDTQCIGHGIEGGKEKAGQDFIADLMRKWGADEVLIDPMSEDVIQKAIAEYGEGNPNHGYEDRFNVYGTFKGKRSDQAPSILFNGHMDTMPPGDLDLWTHSPWDPVVSDGKLYGRGAADMKVGLLAPLFALHLLHACGLEPDGDVKIISVADEEGGGNGSIQAAMNGVRADAAVVCEGTDDELILAHMGFVFFEITCRGLAIHAGNKFLGVSAIEKMLRLVNELHEVEHSWLAHYKHPLLPAPSINIGEIYGGTAGSTVADLCTIKTCVHYLPEIMNRAFVENEIRAAMKRVEAGDAWLTDHPFEAHVYQSGGSYEMDPQHDLSQAFRKAYAASRGKEVNIVGSPGGCDSRVWRNIAQIPTLQFGPGRLAQCHTIDEYVELEQFEQSILIYANLIRNWCSEK